MTGVLIRDTRRRDTQRKGTRRRNTRSRDMQRRGGDHVTTETELEEARN